MEKSFITINGREYRVEVNWNALSSFLKSVGRDTLEGLSDLTSLRPSDIAPLMAAAINEGERLEGRESHLTGESLGEVIRPSDVGKFMEIYIQQSRAQLETDEPSKKNEEQGV